MSEAFELAESLDSVQAFVARFPDPVLLNLESVEGLDQGATFATPSAGLAIDAFRRPQAPARQLSDTEQTYCDDAQEGVIALLGKGSAVAEATPPRGHLRQAEVVVVKKTTRNPFLQMITVGRTLNNDIIVEDKTISKLHAYFLKQGSAWTLHDQCSTNGTYVEKQRVPATGLVVRDGDRISFGSRIVFRFLLPAAFHALVRGAKP